MKLPVDHANRERIRTSLEETLFVEAGAGTGKTTALVGRVVELVRHGTPTRAIAAITFTEAAAAELRDRLRGALEAAATAGEIPLTAVEELDEAAISTLHAFAQRILVEHAPEAGLPPVFIVRDEIQSSLAFSDWWSATLDQLLDDPSLLTTWHAGLATGLRPATLAALAQAMHTHWDRLDAGPALHGPEPNEEDVAHAVDVAASALQHLSSWPSHCDRDTGKLIERVLGLAELGADLASAQGLPAQLSLLIGARPHRGPGYQGWNVDPQQVKDDCDRAEELCARALSVAHDFVLRRLLRAIGRTVLAAAEERRRAGELEFHDLLVLARRVLRDNADVRAALRQRWQRILIDEFQDTDPIQVEIAALLGAAPEAGDHSFSPAGGHGGDKQGWQNLALEPGRLFFVGDARQSIYRFRRADLALFRQVADVLEETIVPLTQNFRSVPAVLGWVNEILGPKMPGYDPLVPARTPLKTATPRKSGGGPVWTLGGEREASLPEIRVDEAAGIAQTIARLTGSDGTGPGWDVLDPRTEQIRPATFDDVAILLPTRTSLDYIENALEEAEIPYRVESASLVWSTQEVRELIAVLNAVEDPGDEVALVAALRAPAFSCGDDELLAWKQAGGRWSLEAPTPDSLPPDHPVAMAMEKLRQFRAERWWAGTSGTVERVARSLGFFELSLIHERARDSWRRLRHVIDEVRSFEEAGGGTLRQFLSWAAAQADEGARVKEAVLPEPDNPAVRILTVHGAKGLEFPVCILAGLNAQPRSNLGVQLLWTADGRVEASLPGKYRTAGFESLMAGEADEAAEEARRLLYVAATRARDHLIVSLHHKAGMRDCHAVTLSKECREKPGLSAPFKPGLLLIPPRGAPPALRGDEPAARREWQARREQLVAQHSAASVQAATDLAKGDDSQTQEKLPWQRGRGGTALGRAVHATLQTVDLSTGARLEETARAQAAAEGIPARAAEVEARARAALTSAAAKEAAAARHWRELYVGAPVGDKTVEGYIDLLYESAEGLVLVDWKTDSLGAHSDDVELTARYARQLGAYADVLQQALGRSVARAVLVFLSEGGSREIEVQIPRAEPAVVG